MTHYYLQKISALELHFAKLTSFCSVKNPVVSGFHTFRGHVLLPAHLDGQRQPLPPGAQPRGQRHLEHLEQRQRHCGRRGRRGRRAGDFDHGWRNPWVDGWWNGKLLYVILV